MLARRRTRFSNLKDIWYILKQDDGMGATIKSAEMVGKHFSLGDKKNKVFQMLGICQTKFYKHCNTG